MISNKNCDDFEKHGSCSCWPWKQAEGLCVHNIITTKITTMSATFLTHALLSLTQGTLTYFNIHIVAKCRIFSWKNGNRCRISDNLLIYIVSVVALFTGFIIETTPSLWVLCMYIMYDCIIVYNSIIWLQSIAQSLSHRQLANNWPNYQNKSTALIYFMLLYCMLYYYASYTYTCRYIHVWYFVDKLCKVFMNLCKYALHKWLFANYHRHGKIRWAKFLLFQRHQSLLGNTFTLPWP